MLCVTFAPSSVEELLTTDLRLRAEGVPLVEWRFDYLTEPLDVAAAVQRRGGPIVFTIRRPEDGGNFRGDETQRRRWLVEAMQAGAEYVDLEEDAAAAIPRTGKSQRVVSMHDFERTPVEIESIHTRLSMLDADVVKLATMARSNHDVFRMLRLVHESPLATVGLCMGEFGVPSRILAAHCGAPYTYAALDDGSGVAPGQISYRTMLDTYRCDRVTPQTRIFGVIGDPIGHSKSPHVHNAAFDALGLDCQYVPFRVTPDELGTFLADAHDLGIGGLSVTIPHKEALLEHLTQAEPLVRKIGAANTIVFSGDDRNGSNTDVAAAIGSIVDRLGGADKLRGKTALVLGAGGAARAIVFGLVEAGAKVVVTNRTPERADELAQATGGTLIDWNDRHDVRADVLVNCTPLGMFPKVDATPWSKDFLRPEMLVFDTVYNPEVTQLLADAREAGCSTVTGVEMFLRQAALQFKLFTGRDAPLEVMREAMP